MGTAKLLEIVIQAGSFIAAFASIAAGVIMASVTKKFGSGILAAGFKSISTGVFLIAIGIFIDALGTYLQISNNLVLTAMLLAKEVFLVIGTYIIVIGSKSTGDKLESLTK
ncbi:hypothetical protein M1615_03835 [Patescibacteria group bacterium]|nr:hypothetical protein [Patescibacteria group bacterium]MCL5010403.1 hypothetical protein [Patescibacteria group bacterium]